MMMTHRAVSLALAALAVACGSNSNSADHQIEGLDAPQFAEKAVYEVDFNGL